MPRWWDQATPDDESGSPTLDSTPVGLMELDTDWVVRYLNTAGEKAVGYTTEELVGRNYWEAFPANTDNEFGRVYRRAVATGVAETVEAFYPEPLNQWFEVNAVPTEHGLWLYFTEVTARRQVQERLALLAQVGDTLAGTMDAAAAAASLPRVLVRAARIGPVAGLGLDRTGQVDRGRHELLAHAELGMYCMGVSPRLLPSVCGGSGDPGAKG